ncbi:hypothetical protein pipiens_018550 [Culex pipiens pipiens]|uniref:Large ribosomal subunit protein eL18 n=1 Tax=Culex pipiens pipiens TaxID=38569 RepID=A0ABD1CB89_CULPP
MSMSRTKKPPIALSRVSKLLKLRGKDESTVAVVVETVINADRQLYVPKMDVCALLLAMLAPTGKNTVLMQASYTAREAFTHFGRAPGVPQSNTRPYVQSKGRMYEKAFIYN